jgi:putative transposase
MLRSGRTKTGYLWALARDDRSWGGENPPSAIYFYADGRGGIHLSAMMERLWRSLKYECVYLHAWETGSEAKVGVAKWIEFYDHRCPHSALGGQPPAVVYWMRNDAITPPNGDVNIACRATDQQVQRVA